MGAVGGKPPGPGGIDVSDVLLNVVKGFAPMVDAVRSQVIMSMMPEKQCKASGA